MTDTITITGTVGTEPTTRTTQSGVNVASFRLASQLRRYDREQNRWNDAGTNWYTVSAWRQLGKNVAESLSKGDRIIVTGALRIRAFERQDGSTGTSMDIDATAIGHDLNVVTTNASYTGYDGRGERARGSRTDESAIEDGGSAGTETNGDVTASAHPESNSWSVESALEPPF